MKCPTCGQICRTDREFCALCGTPLKRKKRKGGLIALLLVLVLLLAAAGYVFLLKDPLDLVNSLHADTPAVQEIASVQEDPTAIIVQETAAMPEGTSRGDVLWGDVGEIFVTDRYTLALCKDGTVKLAGQSASPEFGFDLFDWANITQLVPADFFVAGLTADGRVRLTGEVSGYEEAARWSDVAQLFLDGDTLLGLTRDGHVLAAASNLGFDPSELHDMADIITGGGDTLAVARDGRVTVLRRQGMLWDLDGAYGLKEVACNSDYALFLMEDGTVRTGASLHYFLNGMDSPFYGWENIEQLVVGDWFALGLTRDGRIQGASTAYGEPIPDTEDWSDVRKLLLDRERSIVYGVTGDGRVLAAAASPETPMPELSSWQNVALLQISQNYIAALTTDGRVLTFSWPEAPAVLDCSDWTNVSSIALSNTHLAALTADGGVLTAGDNSFGQCG